MRNIDNFNMPQTAIGIWLNDDIFISKGSSLDNISILDNNALKTSLFNIINSKFKYTHNITIDNNPVEVADNYIDALVCMSDTGTLSYLDNNYIVENKFIILQKNSDTCKIVDGDFKKIRYRYSDGITPFDEGNNTYIVKCLVRDEYEIYIKANSELDAMEKAKNYDIKDWNHLELDTEYTDRVLLRVARWGNFTVREA